MSLFEGLLRVVSLSTLWSSALTIKLFVLVWLPMDLKCWCRFGASLAAQARPIAHVGHVLALVPGDTMPCAASICACCAMSSAV